MKKTNLSKPKVSIIIPVYNSEKHLKQCLDSILNQTFKDVEIICVDDGSTDNSAKILAEYSKADRRIKILSQQNSYAGVARNYGMSIAAGDFLCFLDSDDWFELDMIEKSYDQAIKTDSDIILWQGDYYDESQDIYKEAPWLLNLSLLNGIEIFSRETFPDNLYDIMAPAPWNKLFKASFIKEIDIQYQSLSCSNDIFFVYTAIGLANKISYVPDKLVHYRTGNSNSLQATKRKNPEAFLYALTAIKNVLTSKGVFSNMEKAFVNMALNNCAYNLRTLKDEDAYKKLCLYLNCSSFNTLGINDKSSDYFFNRGNYAECEKAKTCNPDVSVIVPAYNSEKSILRCLESLKKQTHQNIEIICVNDGSSDSTDNILREYSKNVLNLVYVSLKRNRGSLKARETGVEVSRGRYIMFLDSDDEYVPNAVEKAYKAIRVSEVDILQFGMEICPTENASERSVNWLRNFMKPYCKKLDKPKEPFEACFRHSKYSFNITNKIFDSALCKNVLKHLPCEHMTIAEDMYFFFLLSYYSNSFDGIPDNLYKYHYGSGGMGKQYSSINELRHHCEQVYVAELCKDFIRVQGRYIQYDDVVKKVHLNLMGECLSVWRKLRTEEERISGAEILVQEWQETPVIGRLLEILSQECPQYIEKISKLVSPDDAIVPEGFSQTVPIVFATNDKYSIYAGVAIESILKNATPNIYYRIYILHDGLSTNHKQSLENIISTQAKIKCINVDDLIAQKSVTLYEVQHFTKEMYFRFLIPEIFYFYEKVIYLDCDLVVNTNIEKIIPAHMSDYLLAAVKNHGPKANYIRIQKDLGIDPLEYFNSGVLVFNIRKWVEENGVDKCFDVLRTIDPKKLKYCDQDILNIVCENKVLLMDLSWNFYWHMIYGTPEFLRACRPAAKLVGDNYKILHFASGIKPWSLPELPHSKLFWKYARTSAFYEEILFENLTEKISKLTNEQIDIFKKSEKSQIENLPKAPEKETLQNTLSNIKKNEKTGSSTSKNRFCKKMSGGVKCLKEHGFKYTFDRILVHLHLKKDPYK